MEEGFEMLKYTLRRGNDEPAARIKGCLGATTIGIGFLAGVARCQKVTLRQEKVGTVIALILTLLYGCCCILSALSTYALLPGSLVLFAALAAMIYRILKINRA